MHLPSNDPGTVPGACGAGVWRESHSRMVPGYLQGTGTFVLRFKPTRAAIVCAIVQTNSALLRLIEGLAVPILARIPAGISQESARRLATPDELGAPR